MKTWEDLRRFVKENDPFTPPLRKLLSLADGIALGLRQSKRDDAARMIREAVRDIAVELAHEDGSLTQEQRRKLPRRRRA